MMSQPSLAESVYALIVRGDDTDRAIAVALAEAGAGIAIASIEPSRDQEFATASIANEVWSLGRPQLSFPLDAASNSHVQAFANEVLLQLGHCDGVILGLECPYEAGQWFQAAIPTASIHWLAVENIGEGAIPVHQTPSETAAAVVAALR